MMGAEAASDVIAGFIRRLETVATAEDARQAEAAAAAACFEAWAGRVTMTFGRKDQVRVPDRWKTYQGRRSEQG